jgi:hypothetical protein
MTQWLNRNAMPDPLDPTSLLLLYLAGEASASQRAVIEQNLQRDAGWRQQLEALRAMQGQVDEAVAQLDARQPLPVSEGVAVRAATRAMQQWNVDRMLRPIVPAAPRRAKFGWAYALGTAAAVVVIGLFVLWSRVNDAHGPVAQVPNIAGDDGTLEGDTAPTTAPAPLPGTNQNQNIAEAAPADADSTAAVAEALTGFGGAGDPALGDGADSLTRAEQQLANLTYLTENSGEREEGVPQ